MLLLEIGNSTIKVAVPAPDGAIAVERYVDPDAAIQRCKDGGEPVLVAPVGERLRESFLPKLEGVLPYRVIGPDAVRGVIGNSYDTPDTLGLDRVLNLMGLVGDGVVVSCGTAITVDAVIASQFYWGCIMPGFKAAALGLASSVPTLPFPSSATDISFPARTSVQSVTNGVMLGTAAGAHGMACAIARVAKNDDEWRKIPVLLTGGDAETMGQLWDTLGLRGANVTIDDALLFRGMMKLYQTS